MRHISLDTSIIIDFLRRKDKEKSLFYKLTEEKLSISIITHTELFGGKSIWENEETRLALDEVLEGLKILPLTEEISERAGYIRAHEEKTLFDSIIAATALHYDLELATFNRKDFENIKGIRVIDPQDYQD